MKHTRIRGFRRVPAVALAWSLSLLAAPGLSAATFSGVEAVLRDEVIDLRENPQLQKKGTDGKPAGYYTPADLVVGSIFLDVDGNARKVTSIYDSNGSVVIETEQPELEDVFWELTIPDQTISLSKSDIDEDSVETYVDVLDTEEEAAAVLSAVRSTGKSRSVSSRSVIPSESTWLETDPDWIGKDVTDISINFSKSFGSAPKREDVEGTETTTEQDTETEKEASVTVGISLKGLLRLAEPQLKAGFKKPTVHFTWVKVWWIVGYLKITVEKGYAKVSLDVAQQCDFNFEVSVKFEGEVSIPLYALIVTVPQLNLKLKAGLYLKVSITGELTLGFEISEYTTVGVWGSCDLGLLYIPYNFQTGSSNYENVIVRPYVDATVEVKTGPYLGASITIAGINLIGAEIGGGLYAEAEGYLEAMSVVGYNSNAGAFGNWDDWRYDISLELGAYIEANLTILLWDFNLFEKKWPFLRLEASGVL